MTLSDLDDAFRELENRADISDEAALPFTVDRVRRHRPLRPVLVGVGVAAAAAVVASAVGSLHASDDASQRVSGSRPASTSQSTALPTGVPSTQAELIARFRSILADTATFTVDRAHSTGNLITGVLTSASGDRGLYVLEVDRSAHRGVSHCPPGGPSMSSGSAGPSVVTTTYSDGTKITRVAPCWLSTRRPDGSNLQTDPTYRGGPVRGGVMNGATLTRPDGWRISLSTANFQGKYRDAPILGDKPALTTEQVTDIVTSPRWLTKQRQLR